MYLTFFPCVLLILFLSNIVPSSAKKDRENTDERENFEMRRLINDCIDIRSIETLARLHIMIAQVLETSSQESENHILTAAYCVQKIWQVSDIVFVYMPVISHRFSN